MNRRDVLEGVSECFSRETQGSVSLDHRGGMILCDVEEFFLTDGFTSVKLSPDKERERGGVIFALFSTSLDTQEQVRQGASGTLYVDHKFRR